VIMQIVIVMMELKKEAGAIYVCTPIPICVISLHRLDHGISCWRFEILRFWNFGILESTTLASPFIST
jgi:hypothetical protein